MFASLVVSLAIAAAPPSIEPGATLTWRGEITSTEGEATSGKTFEITALVAAKDDAGARLLWVIDEEGRPALSWAHRFGEWNGRAASEAHSRLLCRHESGTSVVKAPSLFASPPEALANGLTWSEDGVDYSVEGEEKRLGRPAWRVSGRSRFGVGQTHWIDKETGLLLACSQSLVVGQGERFTLACDFHEASQLDAAALAATINEFQPWLALREKLGLPSPEAETIWSQEQLTLLAKEMPARTEKGLAPLIALAKIAAEDVRDQKNQSGAVVALANRVLGEQAPKFDLATLEGGKLTSADLGGAVTVLHFWTYRDAPLAEPYGQVGYIDFLHRKRKGQGVKVYGVAVDERFDDPDARRGAIGSVKRFQAFMNLDYPLLLDGGGEIEKFGDPRAAGAKLPLVIVIDAAGKVIHYRAGLYEVDRDQGLQELDAIVGGK